MKLPPLHRVRGIKVYLSSEQVGYIMNKSSRWVRDNRALFEHKRKGEKIWQFELSSVLEYHFKCELS